MPATDKKHIARGGAKVIAHRFKDDIEQLCQSITIAGSIRRKKAFVGDIEIVCVPKHGQAIPPGEMFQRKVNLVRNHIWHHNGGYGDTRLYFIKKGGPRYCQFLWFGMQIDCFMTTPEQYGRMLSLRTGPAEYSKKMAARWKELGYKGHDGELVHIDGEEHRYKPKFPTEKSFFDFLGWEYVEPESRG